MHNYNNNDYKIALIDFQNNNSISINNELKKLAIFNIPSYNEEIYYFLNEGLAIAKEKGNSDIISKIRDVALQMVKTIGSNNMYVSILVDSIQSNNDCVELIKVAALGEQYQSVLTASIKHIKKSKSFQTAVRVVKQIKESSIGFTLREKEDVLRYFIDKMNKGIEIEIRPYKSMFSYKTDNTLWRDFTSADYAYYLDVCRSLGINMPTFSKSQTPVNNQEEHTNIELSNGSIEQYIIVGEFIDRYKRKNVYYFTGSTCSEDQSKAKVYKSKDVAKNELKLASKVLNCSVKIEKI